MVKWLVILCLYSGGLVFGLLAAKVQIQNSHTISQSAEVVSQHSDQKLPVLPKSIPTPIPRKAMLTGGTHIFQTFNNCGPASLSMALSYYDVYVSQEELGKELRPFQHPTGNNDDKSVTLAELAEQARVYGFTAFHRPAGDIELIHAFIAADIPVITRTWLKPNDDIGHYRVVFGYDQDRKVLLQNDSLQGAGLEYREEDFLELWQAFNYEFLVLVPPDKITRAESILGELQTTDGAWQSALRLADRQLLLNTGDIYAQFNRSVALYYLQRYAESIIAFEQVESLLPPRMLWYQIEPILAYFAIGDAHRVFQLTNQVMNTQNPAFSELHYLQAMLLEQQGKNLEASQAYARATQYNSGTTWKKNLPL